MAEIIDLGGRTVLPGLIDCHVHVNAVRVTSGLAASRVLPASFIAAAASQVMRGMLMRGFTTIRDEGGADRGLREAVEQGLFVGPRLFIAGRAISQTGGHGDFRDRIDSPAPCGCDHFVSGIGRASDGVPAVQQAVRDEIRWRPGKRPATGWQAPSSTSRTGPATAPKCSACWPASQT